jgi:hypothetical protein
MINNKSLPLIDLFKDVVSFIENELIELSLSES